MKKQEGEPLAAASVTIPSTESVSQLFAEHYPRMLLVAHRITGSMADAEDIAQSLFLRLASSERPIDNIGSYLHRAAINGALDEQRHRIYAIGGEGGILVFQQRDPDHYDELGRIRTVSGARTGFFSAELDKLYVAVRKHGSQAAEIRVYGPMP